MNFRIAPAVIRLALACACSAPAVAAAQQATVTGTVFDPTDAVVVGASISLKNNETNQVLEARSDGAGRYRIVYAPVGRYQLSVAATGFVITSVDLTLSIGQVIDVPVRLAATATENVTVVRTAPIVDTGRTQLADVIRPQEIDSLPLNGRNYLDLALLVPNVSRHNTRSNERFAETSAVPGSGISVAGQRNLGNTFIVDGLSANDDAADLAGTYYGEDVIREFQVITAGGTAEFGRAAAGTINIVTKSGTNQPRGRGYAFFRHDALDAANALATTTDPFQQQQYGVSFGGPLRRDQLFWFANVERTDQQKTGFVTIAPADAAAIQAALEAFGYPGPRPTTGAFTSGYDTTNVFVRVDRQATAGGRLELRYSAYDVGSPNARGVGGLNDISRGTWLDNADQTVAASVRSLPRGALINELRWQYTNSDLSAPVNDPLGPAITINGVANLGISSSSPTGRALDVIQMADTVTIQNGNQVLKAGGDLLYNRATIIFPGALRGAYTFSSLASLQRGDYAQFQQAFGAPSLRQGNPNLGLFMQDEWRARSSLTINAGVRYDLQWLPEPIQLDLNNVSPRLGVAWAPGSAQTVLRASGGIYYDRIPLRATSNAIQRDGINYKIAVLAPAQDGAPRFPATLPSFPPGVVTAITSIDPEIQNGRSEQMAVQLERAIGRVASATIGYTRVRGREIIMSRNINVPTLSAAAATALGVRNLGRPNPNFGNISQYQSVGDSWFNGLTMSLTTRSGSSWHNRVSYTLSKALDDSGNAFFSTPQDNFDLLGDKGPSDNDQRHRLTLSGSLGGDPNVSSLARRLKGIQIGYLFMFATGLPFNVVTGGDRNNDTNFNDRPVGVGRNSQRMPSTATLDLRVSRTFGVGQVGRIEVMIEAFNVLNHDNILNVNNTFGPGIVASPAFGRPTLVGDPRQMQVGARWDF